MATYNSLAFGPSQYAPNRNYSATQGWMQATGGLGKGAPYQPLQASGPPAASGAIPTSRYTMDGRQVYMPAGTQLPTPAANPYAGMTNQQRLEAIDRANPNPYVGNESRVIGNYYGGQAVPANFVPPRPEMAPGQYVNQTSLPSAIRQSNSTAYNDRAITPAENNRFYGNMQRTANQLADQGIYTGGPARTVNYAAGSSQMPTGGSITYNAQPVTNTGQAYLPGRTNDAARLARMTPQQRALETEFRNWYGNNSAATPLLNAVWQGSGYGDTMNDVNNYFNRTRTYGR